MYDNVLGDKDEVESSTDRENDADGLVENIVTFDNEPFIAINSDRRRS